MTSAGAHFQTPINDWPNAIPLYPDGTFHKSVQDQHLCRDIKNATGQKARTVFRWPVPNDHYDPFLNRPNLEGARDFFSRFVDGTFLELAAAGAFDAVETLNEVYGNGQNEDARTAFINLELDCVDVWQSLQLQNPQLQAIKLCLANTAIGNDIPDEIGQAAYQHGHYVGYHSYVPVQNKQILPGEYQYYSGRFEAMDHRWRARGWYVDWLGTEGGPVGYIKAANGDIHLQGGQGWRYGSVCDRDMNSYIDVLGYWLDRVNSWNDDHGHRHHGLVLFTTSNLNDQWGHFQHNAGELAAIGEYMAGRPAAPPVEPPPSTGIRRYGRVVHLLAQNVSQAQASAVMSHAYPSRESVIWSADDSAMNPDPTQAELTSRIIHVWGDWDREALTNWIHRHYPPFPTILYHDWAELNNP